MAILSASEMFKVNAEQAAEFERQGQYETASAWWDEALKYTAGTSYANLEWALYRSSFCKHWAPRYA
jgi:hypothetical protein